ncbi:MULTISPECIES: hypothetical protein [unclassified Methylobacterium]|uniref:hypothetical protein n=1 Tax=unclassified Methylobacterium TaxID=2615210 RepID=UPI0016505CA9|nr:MULTISPECIES: hypothetical protein [unclassified Methylobacterium]
MQPGISTPRPSFRNKISVFRRDDDDCRVTRRLLDSVAGIISGMICCGFINLMGVEFTSSRQMRKPSNLKENVL